MSDGESAFDLIQELLHKNEHTAQKHVLASLAEQTDTTPTTEQKCTPNITTQDGTEKP